MRCGRDGRIGGRGGKDNGEGRDEGRVCERQEGEKGVLRDGSRWLVRTLEREDEGRENGECLYRKGRGVCGCVNGESVRLGKVKDT